MDSHQQGCPARLAIAVEDRHLARVPRHDFVDEPPQGVQHVNESLMRARCRKETHEINREALAQGDAHLGLALEPAYSRTMTGPWINHDDRRLVIIDTSVSVHFANCGDAQEGIIRGAFETSCVEQHLVLEREHGWHTRLLMLKHNIGPLAQYVPEQYRPLPKVDRIIPK